jgi:ATP-dependent DNA ligase
VAPRRPTDKAATPPTLIAFDCLYARGKDLRQRPLRVRRNVLEELVTSSGSSCRGAG